jgi:basic membrane lipoprotein Med (substrate-binding protein (PBP1-ABC) superfamily)
LLALEDRAGAELALGRHREIAVELDALCGEHPYRERFRGLHMLALYRSGRQAEALRAFQRTRAVLVEELGIEPSQQLRQLEEQILVQDPRGRSRVLVTLRADFYDRPLMHPAFGRLMTGRVVNVVPLAAGELEAAALGPALGVGVTFERGLLAALIDEVSGQPNALPLFQYTLSELFDRRQDSMFTRAAYEALGGIKRAVASRAEAIYQGLDLDQQEAARQLFLRLVTVGRDSETRRVVAASELTALDVDIVTMHGAVEAFVANRLLVRDRDAASGALTVEVAHEALLSEWDRLRRWIDDGRDDLRQHAACMLAVDDWLTAGRDPDYLPTGGRFDQFEHWRATTTMRLTESEREVLDEARRRRDEAEAAGIAQSAEQARLRRRARRRSFALGAALAAVTTTAVVTFVATAGNPDPPQIAIVAGDPTDNEAGALYEQGSVRAERDFDLEIDRREPIPSADTVIADLAAIDTKFVILDSQEVRTIKPDDLDPNTRYVLMGYNRDNFGDFPNVTSQQWADEQAGYLAGIAAATTADTGTVAFLGTIRTAAGQEDYRAGFEAGVHAVDPDITVMSAYLVDFGYRRPIDAPHGARNVAGMLYDAGADVIFHVAGRSAVGVLDAASGMARNHRWAIGVETDQWQSATTRQRPHILTSIIRRFDVQIHGIIADYLDDSLDPGAHRLTAADGVIGYASSGDALSAQTRASLNRAIQQLASGEIELSRTPTGELTERTSFLDPDTGTSYFAGGDSVPVTVTLPAGWEVEEVFVMKPTGNDWPISVSFWDVGDIYADPCQWVLVDPPVGPTVDDLVSAWANIPALDATTAIDVTVDGYEGKQFELTIPDFDEADCRLGRFGLWQEDGPGSGSGPNRWVLPNTRVQLWVLDVDGTRLVISTMYYPDTTAQDRAEINEIIDSVQIG